MSNSAPGETERMVITRVFDAPRELVWKAWTEPEYVTQWWGPKGFTLPVCRIDFRVGGKFLYCMQSPGGQEFWGAGEYREIVPFERIAFAMYMADAQGNKVDPSHYGVEHEVIDEAPDVVMFEDLGSGQTRLTYIGNESMQNAMQSGQLEGMNQSLDKLGAIMKTLA